MNKRNLLYAMITMLLVIGIFVASSLGKTPDGPATNDPNTNNNTDNGQVENPNTGPKLTCFDFINQSLEQDGMKHLGGSIWGRGLKNQFIFDISKLQFSISNHISEEVLPENWYTSDYYRYISWRYVHSKKEAHSMPTSDEAPDRVTGVIKESTLLNPEGNFYEFIQWMNYYTERFNKYGCSIEDLDESTLLGSFKTKKSKATQADVVSVFDRKSEDGVLRYFADVHKPGKIEDHPRFVEISTFEEYDMLDSINREDDDWEQIHFLVATYRDYSKRTYMRDFDNVQGTALTEFIKDVGYEYTVAAKDNPRTPTIGMYFIYIDNPNSDFQYLYKPTSGSGFSRDITTFRIPYETNLIQVNLNEVISRKISPNDPGQIRNQIKQFIEILKLVNPDVKFAEDFATNYTRPFNLRWQAMMGLTELYSEKYNLTVDNIKYH